MDTVTQTREYRVRFETDPSPDLPTLDPGEGPADYLSLGVVIESRCPNCGQWTPDASLWGVDFLESDSPHVYAENDGTLALADALQLVASSHGPTQYLAGVIVDLAEEAGPTYDCPAGCPLVIHPSDVAAHLDWHAGR